MQRDIDTGGRESRRSDYADRLPDTMKNSGIGDSPASDGTPQPWEDVGVGGTADFGGPGNLDDTDSMRVGNVGRGGVLGSRTGSIGPGVGLDTGTSEAMRGGGDAIRDDTQPGGKMPSHPSTSGPADISANLPGERGAIPDVGMPGPAATGAAGVEPSDARLGSGDTGTSDLGAAVGKDLGSGLGGTRSSPSGTGLDQPRGTVSGAGGTRGGGEGTGHLSDAGGSGGLGSGSSGT
jgi:hypothetical protein